MTKTQRERLLYLRGEKQRFVASMVRAAMDAPKNERDLSFEDWSRVRYFAKQVDDCDRKIAELVSDAHCESCGAHELDPCAETCGERVTDDVR